MKCLVNVQTGEGFEFILGLNFPRVKLVPSITRENMSRDKIVFYCEIGY